MNKGWRKITLGEEIDLRTGFPFKSSHYSEDENDIRLLRGDNIVQGSLRWTNAKRWPKHDLVNCQEFFLCEGDVVLAMDRPWINAGLKFAHIKSNDLPCLQVQRTARLRGGENLRTDYLKYIIGSPTFTEYVKLVNTGSNVPHISSDQIKDFSVVIPPIDTQKAIAKTLSDLDAKIELNNKINAELEAMAKLIYDYWFVQFDFPVYNEDGTLSGVEGYRSSGGKMVYNAELKREIPEGWESGVLKNLIDKDKSGDWGKESEQGNYVQKVSCIRGADINGLNGKGVVKSPTRYILEKNRHKILEKGDIIVEISGGSPTQSTGRLAFIIDETIARFDDPLICSNFCKAVTLKEENSLYNFVYQWNRLYDAGVLFGWEGKTSGIKNLLFDSFVSNYKVELPPLDLMEQFHEKITPIHSKIQKNLAENNKLAELRDWLLPMLMNGQVTVK